MLPMVITLYIMVMIVVAVAAATRQYNLQVPHATNGYNPVHYGDDCGGSSSSNTAVQPAGSIMLPMVITLYIMMMMIYNNKNVVAFTTNSDVKSYRCLGGQNSSHHRSHHWTKLSSGPFHTQTTLHHRKTASCTHQIQWVPEKNSMPRSTYRTPVHKVAANYFQHTVTIKTHHFVRIMYPFFCF